MPDLENEKPCYYNMLQCVGAETNFYHLRRISSGD